MRLSAPIHTLKRRARLLSRSEGIPLHEALDRIAAREGFASWSLLSTRLSSARPPAPSLADLSDGDLLLLAARPRQGKTRLGLQLLLDAARAGRRAVFFTLEYTDAEARSLLHSLASGPLAESPEIVATDDIGAALIVQHLGAAAPGTLAVIDYLQILDQQRSKPPLSDQLAHLQDFARRSGVILCFLSQIDRSYDPALSALPGPADLRLPNPVPEGVF